MSAAVDQEVEGPPGRSIDPRIRARRVAVRREEGRRRRNRLARLAVVLAVVLVAWLVTRSPLLDVDDIRIVGATHVTPEAVAGAGRVGRGDAMTDVDTSAVARRIESLPWVESATVTRRWPGTVAIEVRERVPVVAAGAVAGGYWAVDARGHLVEHGDAPLPGLLLVEGDPVTGEAGDRLPDRYRDALVITGLLPPGLAGAVVAVVVPPADGEAGLGLRLAAGGSVVLGDASDLRPKLVAVVTVAEHVDLACVSVLDVRVPTAPVLTRSDGCA
jgi:cell division protein FtsQ